MSGHASAIGRTRLGAALLALSLAAACATRTDAPQTAGTPEDRDMFVSGYEDIESVYIDPVDFGSLTVSGLDELATIDPKLDAARDDDHIVLLVDGVARDSFSAPPSGRAADWGILAASALAAARDESSLIREAQSELLYKTIFTGVMDDLDEFSRYSSAAEAADQKADREGFGGIGIVPVVEDQNVRIVSVMHATPAERGGLLADDIITAVDGNPLTGLDLEAIVHLLRGQMGSTVRVTILRAGATRPIDIQLTRAHIVPETVTYKREGDAGYIRIHRFNVETSHSVATAIENARQEIGPGLRGYILDLRRNPGGILDQAVEVADLFLDRGPIVSSHGRHPDSHQYFEATDGDIAEGKPIVVLINGDSASAAEIVAAALQDTGRAAVIGTNSYGKGTVQHIEPMPNDGEMILTWARFHAPSGYTLNHLGVLPSICTNEIDSDAGPLLAALRAGTLRPVPTVLRNATDPRDEPALNQLRAACPVKTGERPAELQLALQLLAEPALYRQAIHLAETPAQAAAAHAAPP